MKYTIEFTNGIKIGGIEKGTKIRVAQVCYSPMAPVSSYLKSVEELDLV